MILSVVSAKGGVGKTTLAANLSKVFSAEHSVLAVDLDPQNALRLHSGIAVHGVDGVARASLEGRSWSSAVSKTASPRLSVLPYGELKEEDRDAFEVFLSSRPNWLIDGLNQLALGSSDLVVIDTPPGPSLYQQQVLRASHFVLVVVHADAASYATLAAMESSIDRYCVGRGDFLGYGYLLNSVHVGSALSRDVMRVMRANLGERVLPMVVHQDEAVREALAMDQFVQQYAPNSEAANDVFRVGRWVLQGLRPLLTERTRANMS